MGNTQQMALAMGGGSACAFPIGALIGIFVTLSEKTLAVLLSFGAGGLLFALSVELFGEVVLTNNPKDAVGLAALLSVTVSALLGSILFVVLNTLLGGHEDEHGKQPRERIHRGDFSNTGSLDAYAMLGDEEAGGQHPAKKKFSTSPGWVIGSVNSVPGSGGSVQTGSGGSGHGGSARGGSPLRLGGTSSRGGSPQLSGDLDGEISQPGVPLVPGGRIPKGSVARNPHGLRATLRETIVEVANTQLGGGGTAMSMWLGVMLDGVPEAMVFGFLATQRKASMSLVFGVFIANLPEAVSSASMMRQQGMSILVIMAMWTALVLVTGGGALLTTLIFKTPHTSVGSAIVIDGSQGLAGGAMLAMVSSAMIPEALKIGGPNIVSLVTVAGFVTAFVTKAFGESH